MQIEAPWLKTPETRAVMAALETAKSNGSRFVGGCVRNTLRGTSVDDIDIATQLEPDATIAALEDAGIRAIPTGKEHGTITAVKNGVPFEITTLRRDVETDGRRAVVAFTEDWREDAERRDFRLNAIYAETDGTLREVIAGGIEDALAGRVIFIGEADQRLREDYLRILRFFRFNAWYGSEIDPEGLSACHRQKAGLKKIAAERIWKELKKMLAAPDPSTAAEAMTASGVLEEIFEPSGFEASTNLLPALVGVEAKHSLLPDPMRRIMSIIPRRKSDVGRLGEALRFSNGEKNRLLEWAAPDLPNVLEREERAVKVAIYRHGAEAVVDRAIIEAAQGGANALTAVLALCSSWLPPSFPIGGDDALAAGFSGAEIGVVLRRVETAWIESDFTLQKDELLKRLKS